MTCLRTLSASALASASRTMRSISSSLRPPEDWMEMFCSLPVALSLAETLTRPSALMSKVTSICGTPRGAGGMPVSSKLPRTWLSAAISRSPWRTLMPTWVWLSAAVEKTWAFLVGMVVLRLIRRVKTPPRVSMPSESGVTSSRRMSVTSPRSTPPWMAAPMATTSSGLTFLEAFLLKIFSTVSTTLGMRDIPPTRMTSSISLVEMPASVMHFLQGMVVRSMRSLTRSSNLARETLTFRCLGPLASAVMKARLMSACLRASSSRLAFSAASRRRWVARASPRRSMPESFLNSSRMYSMRRSSKSSPPSAVSPLVALTSKTPPAISRMLTSKVPPPRSKTAMRWSSALSQP
mmetsp:Transcript_7974/g.20326  ORF Transcript_7974/g.20326 Transcript_7974/m.20326 type:complete len:350 (+) Transcript_7974:441-1490(+)